MKKAKGATPFWKELVDWIDQEYKKKKGRSYPFDGKSLALLKKLAGWLTVPECMALYTCYIARSPWHGPRSGYLIAGFWEERSVLLEDAAFKNLTAMHEKRLGLADPAKVCGSLGLAAKGWL